MYDQTRQFLDDHPFVESDQEMADDATRPD
jgi:hypothetical protein